MNAKDRINYFSVIDKINKGKIDSLSNDEMEWLRDNQEVVSDIKKERNKRSILKNSPGIQDTIEEILFVLDLSDRMYR
jgi:hypothetical protein